MGKKRTTAAHKAAAGGGATSDENNVSLMGGLVPGATLEDYFHSKKFADRKDPPVSKHLLVGSPTNNAMAVEREQENGETEKEGNDDPELASRSLADASVQDASSGMTLVADSLKARGDDKKHTDEDDAKDCDDEGVKREEEEREGHATGRGGDDDAKETSNHDEYEDDYESESLSPDTSVAGMTLSDYLHAKEAKNLEDEDDNAGAKHTVKKPQHEAGTKAAAAPKKAAPVGAPKKPNSHTLVSGMSLDHYLGASSSTDQRANDNGDPSDNGADSKSPTSKRKKSKHKVGTKSLLSCKPVAGGGGGTSSTGSLALAQNDSATPFQKRQTKKLKAKPKQQQQQATGGGTGGALLASKAILLADSGATATTISLSHSSQSLVVQTKATSLSKDKKKLSPRPLPKILASASSTHTMVHEADYGGSDDHSSGDSEKLPPLAHHH